MKLVINYDFFNAIKDINDPLPLKIVRHEVKYKILPAVILPMDYMCSVHFTTSIAKMLMFYGFYMGLDSLIETLYKSVNGEYTYTRTAERKLKTLPALLDTINVSTNFDMLLFSELYKQSYKYEKCDDTIIPIKEEKYIYVPSFGYDGSEKETSILQEHNLGSSNYILSVKEPAKHYRRVLVRNNA